MTIVGIYSDERETDYIMGTWGGRNRAGTGVRVSVEKDSSPNYDKGRN